MSCKACDDFQDGATTSYYRWKNANIEVRGCDEHLREVFDALNKAQRNPQVEPTFQKLINGFSEGVE